MFCKVRDTVAAILGDFYNITCGITVEILA